jgi:membrane fusion protein, multidrug efflux system
MKRKIVVAVVALIVVGAAIYAWLSWRAQREAQANAARVPVVPVVVAEVTRATVPVKLSVIGRAEAKSTVTLKSRVDGQVAAIAFKEGQPVRKGQLLVQLDPASFAAQVRQVEATRAKDQAQLDKLQLDIKRNTDLFQKGFISQAALNQTQADLSSAQAAVRADTANVDTARLLLSYTTIRAPMDSVAGTIQVYPGGVVKINDTPLVVLNQVQPIYVTFSVPETRLAQLKRALAKGPVSVAASVEGDSKTVLRGSVAFIDNAVDATTGTIVVKALFPNADALLTPGQFVNVALVVDQLADALIVPASAVQTGPKGDSIFVVKADQTVELRPVTVAVALADQVVLAGGVAPGEKVVTDGQLRLKAGSKIKIAGAGSEPASVQPPAKPLPKSQ